MKTFICLVLCALVAATYAAPARLSLQDRAEIEGFMDFLKKAGKVALKVAPHLLNGGAEAQDDDDDDNDGLANIEVLLSQSLQDRAEIEGFLSTLGKIGKGALGLIGGRAQEQEMTQAEAQFWGSLVKTGLGLLGKKK